MKSKKHLLYKFYSLQDENKTQYALDMLKQQELFLTNYKSLQEMSNNDNKEGVFFCPKTVERDFLDQIKDNKQHLLIGCVTSKVRNAYLWKHYGGEGKGICIAFEIGGGAVIARNVNYTPKRITLGREDIHKYTPDFLAKQILLNKTIKFARENECRILKRVTDNQENIKLSIKIHKVYFGWSIDDNVKKQIQNEINDKYTQIQLHKAVL